jgi:ribose transport system substrate-binding protein
VKKGLFRLLAGAALATLAACGGSASTSSGGTSGTGGTIPKGITIGFGNAAPNIPFLDEQSRILKGIADRYGWKVVELNNNADGPTALKNVDQFVLDHVNYIIEFQIDATINPVLCAKTQAAHIPVITEGIPGPCEYFTSASDRNTGLQAGRELGNYAKQHFGCSPDLVVLAQATATGDASRLRVGGVHDGIMSVCPSIPESTFGRFELGLDNATSVANARNVLVAHPSAQKILVGGLNDLGVSEAMTAAEQLNRADQLWAFGADGSGLGTFTDTHYGGSVQYFLESGVLGPVTIITQLAQGKAVHKGFSPSDPTLIGQTCPMTAAQGQSLPNVHDRATAELAAYPNKTAAQLYCPSGTAS